jgi:hypothetical protein
MRRPLPARPGSSLFGRTLIPRRGLEEGGRAFCNCFSSCICQADAAVKSSTGASVSRCLSRRGTAMGAVHSSQLTATVTEGIRPP